MLASAGALIGRQGGLREYPSTASAQELSSSLSRLNMTLIAPVWAARAAQSKAACTSFSENPNRWVIMGATSTRLLSMSLRHSGYCKQQTAGQVLTTCCGSAFCNNLQRAAWTPRSAVAFMHRGVAAVVACILCACASSCGEVPAASCGFFLRVDQHGMGLTVLA